RADVVLDGDGHAGERRVAPARRVAIERLGARQGAIAGDGVERVERGIDRVDARQRVAADLDRRAIARSDRVAHGPNRHHRTRGTLNRPASSAAAGALARAVSRSTPPCVSWARSAACRMTMLAVGGTRAVSICCTWSA